MNFINRRKRRPVVEINLTPLIDIVFNLLIFFLITTTFVQNPGIEVELPKASTSPGTEESDNVIIAITAEGRIIHEGKAVTDEELQTRLTEHHKVRSEAMIIIQADTKTAHGKVVEVMDVARQAGFMQLAIATESE